MLPNLYMSEKLQKLLRQKPGGRQALTNSIKVSIHPHHFKTHNIKLSQAANEFLIGAEASLLYYNNEYNNLQMEDVLVNKEELQAHNLKNLVSCRRFKPLEQTRMKDNLVSVNPDQHQNETYSYLLELPSNIHELFEDNETENFSILPDSKSITIPALKLGNRKITREMIKPQRREFDNFRIRFPLGKQALYLQNQTPHLSKAKKTHGITRQIFKLPDLCDEDPDEFEKKLEILKKPDDLVLLENQTETTKLFRDQPEDSVDFKISENLRKTHPVKNKENKKLTSIEPLKRERPLMDLRKPIIPYQNKKFDINQYKDLIEVEEVKQNFSRKSTRKYYPEDFYHNKEIVIDLKRNPMDLELENLKRKLRDAEKKNKDLQNQNDSLSSRKPQKELNKNLIVLNRMEEIGFLNSKSKFTKKSKNFNQRLDETRKRKQGEIIRRFVAQSNGHENELVNEYGDATRLRRSLKEY